MPRVGGKSSALRAFLTRASDGGARGVGVVDGGASHAHSRRVAERAFAARCALAKQPSRDREDARVRHPTWLAPTSRDAASLVSRARAKYGHQLPPTGFRLTVGRLIGRAPDERAIRMLGPLDAETEPDHKRVRPATGRVPRPAATNAVRVEPDEFVCIGAPAQLPVWVTVSASRTTPTTGSRSRRSDGRCRVARRQGLNGR
jgi:hypothetical protein